MRMRWVAASIAVGSLALAAGPSRADDVQDQLRQMQEQLQSLEDRLQVTHDELAVANERVEAQEAVIRQARLAEGADAASGLASFLESLEIGGWVAGSYNYNLDNPDGADLAGFNSGTVPVLPFHPDPNSFSVDQFWLELERPISEEHRAGFRVDLVYGKTAELLNANEAVNPDGFSGSDEDFELYQAYIQYLAPVGNGVTIVAGKFGTIFGAEVAQAPYNFNITRGNVYNLFQPITHVGVTASTDLGGGISGTLGLVNETRAFPAVDVDLNKNKAVLASLGWSGDHTSATLNGIFGASDGGQGANTKAGDKETILGILLNWDPNDRLSGYVNANYLRSENSLPMPAGTITGEVDGYGVSVGGRLALSDRMGVALRGEWVDLAFDVVGSPDQAQKIIGLTGTVDYLLTADLMVRGEVRYDNLRSGTSAFKNGFFDSRSGGPMAVEDDQVVGLVEAIYSFNGF